MISLLSLFLNCTYFLLRVTGSAGCFPRPLTAVEEREALLKAADGDLAARNRLIEHNLRLVAHVIKKYYASASDQDDLISIGTIGLIKAISTFDINKGARLATYAARCIENEILMYFRTLKKQSCEVSLSEPLESDKDGNVLNLMDILSHDDDILDEIDCSERSSLLYQSIYKCLDEREQEVVIGRYGLLGHAPLTQREIAKTCNISRSYVSRIEKRALKKLEHVLHERLG